MPIYAPFRFLIAAAAALVIATVIASSSAHAMLLGDAVAQSALGAPLRAVIPVKPARGESLDSACFRLVPNAAGAGAPIVTAKVSLERTAATPRLIVTTPNAVSEPAVQFTIQAGCDGTTRRNYVLLLDPPAAGAAAIRPLTAREPGQERPKTAASAARHSADNAPLGESRAAPPRTVATDHASDTTVVAVAPAGESDAATVSPAAFRQVAAPISATETHPAAARAPPTEGEARGNFWWYLAALLVAIGAITLGTLFVRRHWAGPQIPEWTRGGAYAGPRSYTDMAAVPVTLSHAQGTPMPSISSGTKPRSIAPSQFTVEATAPPGFGRRAQTPDISTLDTLISDISEADLVEERAVREAWAAARSDVERESDGNAVLRAIEAAERDLLFAPAPPAQTAMDRALDDDLLAALPRLHNKAAA